MGVKWQELYPGGKVVPTSDRSSFWSAELGLDFREVVIETNVHRITLVSSDVESEVLASGWLPSNVGRNGSDPEIPIG